MFIVTKKIDGDNISKVCRTCLREDNDKMVCLFIGPPESSLGAKLSSLSCLKVSQGDGLPEKMCDRCVMKAESALLFREQCRAADQALREAALQVSRDKACPTVSSCKVYQQNQSFPLPYAHSASTFPDCRTLTNYQDFYIHNHFHTPFYQREENLSQHMHIVESHNAYLTFNRYGNSSIYNGESNEVIPSYANSLPQYHEVSDRSSCALRCSLCNYTFSNRTQLVNHNISHNSDNADLSSDEINIEDNSNIDKNISYEKCMNESIESTLTSINNSSFEKNNSHSNHAFDHNHFSQNRDIERTEINNIQSDERTSIETRISEIIENNKFKCHICSKLFSQKSKLTAHEKIHNRKKPFECVHCGKSYSSKSKLAAHTRLHTQTNVHQCNICQKIFSYPSYLNEHAKTHSPKDNIKKVSLECAQCKKQFNSMKSFKRHMRFHTGKDLFHCDICDKLFNQKYLLKMHIRTHQSIKLHECNLCQKSFNQKSNLVEHMRIHRNIKPFKCKVCEKSFVQSSHLKTHEISHNSVRQFQCKICGKRFKLSSHLKRHTNLHSGLKMYKCDQCDQVFSQAFSLKRHSKKHMEL